MLEQDGDTDHWQCKKALSNSAVLGGGLRGKNFAHSGMVVGFGVTPYFVYTRPCN
jgi:hypothetical protein